jgi:hypothetical protein
MAQTELDVTKIWRGVGLTKLDNVRSSGEDGRHNAIEK